MAKERKPPYVRQEGKRGGLAVWIVDGAYIRSEIDEEFTNFGQHYQCPYIPEKELWIDQGVRDDERPFFIEHLLVEYRLMSKGVPYSQALEEADKAERTKRRRAGDVSRMKQKDQSLPDPTSVHKQLWKTLENGVTVWVVDGRLVRSVFDIDFTAGGHEHVYEFVPKGEVWIDDSADEKERGYFLVHELHERNLMAKGEPYSRAHASASKVELRCRQHPDELHNALAAEGWD
jgi:transposase InsO family protein